MEHSAILLTAIKLSFVIKIFVLSIFEWPFYTGFTVLLLLSVYARGESLLNISSLWYLDVSWWNGGRNSNSLSGILHFPSTLFLFSVL